MEKCAYYKTKIGIIKITYDKKIRSIELVDEIGKNKPSDLSDRAIREIREYLDGSRTSFDILSEIELHGTDFSKKVWRALLDIPYGETRSYKDIGEAIGNPRALQAVGTAIGHNPIMIIIPCHRVIKSDGSLGGYEYGPHIKQILLDIEGAVANQ